MSKSFPIGWNIDHGDLRPWLKDNDYAGLFSHLDKLRPKTTLIMDSIDLAGRIKARYPDMVVIHRDYSAHEGDEWQERNPQDFVNRWKQQGHKDVVRYLTNEPSFGAHNARQFAQHEADTIRLAHEAGFQVVAFNENVGGFERSWLADMNPLWHAIVKYNAYMGYHSYFTVSIPMAFEPIEYLSDPITEDMSLISRLQPDKWRIPDLTPSKDSPYWWMLRESWVIAHMLDLGYSQEQLTDIHIETEFGYDNILGDGNPIVDGVINTLRLTFGIERFNFDMRGVNSYLHLHDVYYPTMTYFERMGKEFMYWAELTDKAFWKHSSCGYALNADWHLPEAHDYSCDEMKPFFPVLENLSIKYRNEDTMTQPTPIEPFNPTLYEADVRVTTGTWNMRPIMVASPAVEVIGELTTQSRTMLVSKERAQGSAYEWYKFKEGDTVGYFAYTEKLEIQYKAATTPDEPDDTPTDGITQEQVTEIAKELLEAEISRLLAPRHVDIPIPAFTFTLPEFMREVKAQEFEAIGKTYLAMAQRIREGTPTASQIADVGFEASGMAIPFDANGNLTSWKWDTTDNEVAGGTDVGDTAITFTKEPDTDSISTVSGGTDNEPADDTNEQTLTLNGDNSEGDDDSNEELVA